MPKSTPPRRPDVDDRFKFVRPVADGKIQADCKHPERVVIGHPFNPVYLLPLVEIVPGQKTVTPRRIERAAAEFYESIGMHALQACARRSKAIFRTGCRRRCGERSCIWSMTGVATTGELDDAIIYGPGLRWALMGTCLTFHLAGGE